MSMVETSAISVEPAVPASVLLTSTSVGRARHDRATPGSATRGVRASDARKAALRSPGCGKKSEPTFLVAPSADRDRGRFLRTVTLCLSRAEVKDVLRC